MSKTPVLTSGDVNFSVAFHLSNVPSIATEAFTLNLIVLFSGVITKTGASARHSGGSATDARRQKTAANLMVLSVSLFRLAVNLYFPNLKRLFRGQMELYKNPWRLTSIIDWDKNKTREQ
jgi:hypothetical protein